jgi:hypothetical protein
MINDQTYGTRIKTHGSMTNSISQENNPKEIFYRYFTDADFDFLFHYFFKEPKFSIEEFWADEKRVEDFLKLLFLAGLLAKGMVELIKRNENLLPARIHDRLLLSLQESDYAHLNHFGGPTFQALVDGFELEKLTPFFEKKEINWAVFSIDLKNFFIRETAKKMVPNIYSRAGSKLIYLDKNGYDEDREEANKFLKKGELYTVDHVDIFKYSSTVYLKEFPEMGFNMVMFRNYYPSE